MDVYHGVTIGADGYVIQAPVANPGGGAGCALVYNATGPKLEWTARPVLIEPASSAGANTDYLSPTGWRTIPAPDLSSKVSKSGDTMTGALVTPMLKLGGATSSYPALKPNSDTIQVRLADDSGYGSLTASDGILSGNAQVAGKVVIGATVGSIYTALTKLHVKSTSGAMCLFENTSSSSYAECGLVNDGGGANRCSLYYTGSAYAGWESHPNTLNFINPRSTTNAWLQLGTNNSPRLAITETGLVGVNLGPKVTPSAAFHVGTASQFDGNISSFTTGHTDTFTLPGNATAQLQLTNDGGSLGFHHHYYPAQQIDRWVWRVTPNATYVSGGAKHLAVGYLYNQATIETDMGVQFSTAGMILAQSSGALTWNFQGSTQAMHWINNGGAANEVSMKIVSNAGFYVQTGYGGTDLLKVTSDGTVTQTSSTRWTIPATGQRKSEVGNGSGTWQTGYREEYNAAGLRCAFYGGTPVAIQTLPAAATDAATTQSLANAIRTALIALNLAA